MNVFPHRLRVARFPALSRACLQKACVFLRLPPLTRFPALSASFMFSRTARELHVFPRLPPEGIRFGAFTATYTSSRIIRELHVFRTVRELHGFPRSPPEGMRFPVLTASYTFSRTFHELHVFPRLPPGIRFPALRAFHKLLGHFLATSRISSNFFRFEQLFAF